MWKVANRQSLREGALLSGHSTFTFADPPQAWVNQYRVAELADIAA
jgi:hypothetical protein